MNQLKRRLIASWDEILQNHTQLRPDSSRPFRQKIAAGGEGN